MGFITDAEFLLLHEASRSDRLDFPNKSIQHFLCWTKMEPSVQLIKGREASHNYVKISMCSYEKLCWPIKKPRSWLARENFSI